MFKKTKKEAVMHYLIKDTDFLKISQFLEQVKGIHTNNVEKLRFFCEAVCYVLRSGCQWRLLPIYYGRWRAVHKRFKAWADRMIWQQLFENFQTDPDMESVMIDSTIVRAHACAAGYGKDTQKQEALGRSRGGFSTKIHVLVDALGNPLRFLLTPGQQHDITQAEKISAGFEQIPHICDTAYDADHFTNSRKVTPCIPSRKNRKKPRAYDEVLYQERSAVECFIGKIKHFRRVFSRFDKSARVYLSFLCFAGALIWLR
jgi:transposase